MDLLSDILGRLRLKGTLYFRTSFTSPWGVKVPSYKNVARFHFVHKGRCLVRVEGVEDAVLLEQGDLIVIMRGESHTLYCDPKTELDSLPLDEVLEKSGFSGKGSLVYGEFGTGHETQLVCGHFEFQDFATHPLIDELPRYIHINNYSGDQTNWLESSLKIIGAEAGTNNAGSDLIAIKLSEIIFVQTLRSFLDEDGQQYRVLSGLIDDKISKVLTAIHENPSYNWTLDELAKTAGQSRTAFATHFSKKMAMSPLTYITNWRMQLARQQLVETPDPMIIVAECAGYQSEAAFGRVFKKYFTMAPATFRREYGNMDTVNQHISL